MLVLEQCLYQSYIKPEQNNEVDNNNLYRTLPVKNKPIHSHNKSLISEYCTRLNRSWYTFNDLDLELPIFANIKILNTFDLVNVLQLVCEPIH